MELRLFARWPKLNSSHIVFLKVDHIGWEDMPMQKHDLLVPAVALTGLLCAAALVSFLLYCVMVS